MTTYRFFHQGEVEVQAAAGTDTAGYEQAAAQMMTPDLKENEVQFVSARTFSVAASIDESGRPWASVLFAVEDGSGDPLFTVESPTVVRIAAQPKNGDPLVSNIASRGELGVLYFDPSRRRRSKSMGTATVNDDGSIRYVMTRNFGLCPKYIFKRTHEPAQVSSTSRDAAAVGNIEKVTEVRTSLNSEDRVQLEAMDTLFLASFSPQRCGRNAPGRCPGIRFHHR